MISGYTLLKVTPGLYLKKILRVQFCVFLQFLFLQQVFSQDIILRGIVYDHSSNQALSSVSVFDKTTSKGVISDEAGAFRIALKPGEHTFTFSFIGYERLDTTISTSGVDDLIIYMIPLPFKVGEITIKGEYNVNQVTSPLMGSFTLTNSEILALPSLLGEIDPLKLLQLTPGIQSGSYGGVGFFVRGGGVDQNLVLFDNTIIYNPGHLLGIFSVFNPELIRDVSVIKSGIPACYGGKLSSVIRLNSYKGDSDSISFKGSVGLISSRGALSGPLFKGKGTFVIAARRTYIQLLVRPILRNSVNSKSFLNKDNIYNFYDLNAGFSLQVSKKDLLGFSSYYGKDNYKISQEGISQENFLHWGNQLASLSWEHKNNSSSVWNTKISWSGYNFNLKGSQGDYYFKLFSSVEDLNLKTEYSFRSNNHLLKTGFEFTNHKFLPNRIEAQAGKYVLNFRQFGAMNAIENGVFIDDEYNVFPGFSISAGLRISSFNHMGPYSKYARNALGQVTDTINYPRGKSLAFYAQPEPRAVLKYEFSNNSSLKASYMRVAQYVHLATSASSSLPADIWIPSTSEIKPLIGDQVSMGYFKNFEQNGIEFSVEAYFKKMRNQLEFLQGIVNISIEGNMVDNMAIGKGRSYGLELYLAKKTGKTTGWLSYTLSRTEQRFDEINDGLFYPAKHDRTHDVTLTFMRKFNKKWSGSAVFIYVTGNAFTMPVGRYIIQGNAVNQYGKVNGFRMPDNHRLDISLIRKITSRRNLESELVFSVYNVYNRANPYFIYYEIVGNVEKYSLEVKAFEVTLFPVLPSISWNFKF